MTDLAGLFWPAFFAGGVAIGVTVAIERWGGRSGGMVGTLPTTIVPAAIGISQFSSDVVAFRDAMLATPVGMLVSAVFLYTWRFLPVRLPDWNHLNRLLAMVICSLLVWASCAGALVWIMSLARKAGIPVAGFGFSAAALILVIGVAACLRNPPAPSGSRKVGAVTLACRGLLAGAAIAFSVWLAGVGGPLLAGVFAVFPAIFLTTMVALWLSQGEAVQGGAVGPMMLGSTSVACFSLVAAYAMPVLGEGWGAACAWCIAASCVTYPAWRWLGRLQATGPMEVRNEGGGKVKAGEK